MSSFEIAQVSPPVVYGAQLNQPSNNAYIAQTEFDEFKYKISLVFLFVLSVVIMP